MWIGIVPIMVQGEMGKCRDKIIEKIKHKDIGQDMERKKIAILAIFFRWKRISEDSFPLQNFRGRFGRRNYILR